MKKFLVIISFVVSFTSFSQEGHSKKTFYRDGVLAIEKWYGLDSKIDSLKSYDRTGKPSEIFYYNEKGKFHGLCYKLDTKGKKTTSWKFNNGKLIERVDHIKHYTLKNKDIILKRYEKIEKLNKRLKRKYSFSAFYSRAHTRDLLGDHTLALHDFLWLKKFYEKYRDKETDSIGLLRKNKTLASIYNVLGGLYSSYEQEEKTIHYRFLAKKHKPNDAVYDYNLGGYLVSIQQYKLGIHYLEKLLERGSKHSFANWAMSIAHTDLGNYQTAQEYLNTARAHERSLYTRGYGASDKELNTLEGYLSHKLGDTDKGIKFLNKALEIKPDNSYAMKYLGEIYLDLKNYDIACEYLEKSKELGYEKKFDRDDLQPLIDQACDRVVDTTQKELDVFASPNPVIYFTEIQNFPKNFNYILFDYEQRKVKSGKAVGNTLNLSSLQSGLYILQIENNGVVKTLKIIKH
ncbi:T9SS type A sorting domain-containing protein [Wenyingzhuangia sp. IMCC45574]